MGRVGYCERAAIKEAKGRGGPLINAGEEEERSLGREIRIHLLHRDPFSCIKWRWRTFTGYSYDLLLVLEKHFDMTLKTMTMASSEQCTTTMTLHDGTFSGMLCKTKDSGD